MNGWGSGELMMHVMWTRLPSKVVLVLCTGSRNSYSLLTQERELQDTTLWESCRCKVSLTVISLSCSRPVNPVLIIQRKSMSS